MSAKKGAFTPGTIITIFWIFFLWQLIVALSTIFLLLFYNYFFWFTFIFCRWSRLRETQGSQEARRWQGYLMFLKKVKYFGFWFLCLFGLAGGGRVFSDDVRVHRLFTRCYVVLSEFFIFCSERRRLKMMLTTAKKSPERRKKCPLPKVLLLLASRTSRYNIILQFFV